MPSSRISASIWARSVARKRAKAAGPSAAGSRPSASRRGRSAGWFTASAAAAAARAMAAAGVPAGASMPSQSPMAKPAKPCSATVGTSGCSGLRAAEEIARTLTRPSRISGAASAGEVKPIGVSPRSRPATWSAPPR